MEFLDIGLLEILIVLFLVLVVFGPEKMVQTARTVGKYVRQAQMIATQLSKQINEELGEDAQELKETGDELSRELQDIQENIKKELTSPSADEGERSNDD